MASLQKIALFLFFDAIENDLVAHCRSTNVSDANDILTERERQKARETLANRQSAYNLNDDSDLLHGLDIGEKFDALLRRRKLLPHSLGEHLASKKSAFDRCISVRNSVMHGRPLTIDEYALGFALSNELLKAPKYWLHLTEVTKKYKDDPRALIENSTKLLEQFDFPETLHNLPNPDYDDTGFYPRPKIEKNLKTKILGRHPVVTVLGDGGNGKSAVTLQTLYGLLAQNDHDFDAIIWVSAKSSKLTTSEVERIEGAITSSLDAFGEVARFFEDNAQSPMDRVRSLLESNKILLVIDNLETILDKTIIDFASDVPGESKLLLTSRIPLGSDLTVIVDPFSPPEAVAFLRRLAATYNIARIQREGDEVLRQYAARLDHKPLLLKWFALGVLSGLNPASIVSNPETALRFVLENVFERLTDNARRILRVMSALPKPASIAVLDHVLDESADTIESGISELMRFTIVEQDASRAYEIEYRVKPLAKAYLVRVLGEKSKNIEEIMAKYRAIDAIFQGERAGGTLDRYNPRNYVVRSRSEALAVRKIRKAVHEALKSNYEGALSTIEELKRSNADFFEVLRVEGFICGRMGDLPRAQMAYESAVELDNSHPQLHHYYGGFLMRSFNDFEAALNQFEVAMGLDPGALPPIVEAARSKMFLHDFDGAQKLIDRALGVTSNNLRSEIILFDLHLQNFGRRFEAAISSGNQRECIRYISDFVRFLSGIAFEHLDNTLVGHLRKYQRVVTRLKDILGKDASGEIAKLENAFDEVLALIPSMDPRHNGHEDGQGLIPQNPGRTGRLKKEGLKPNFGFIRDDDGEDTFVLRAAVGEDIWQKMVQNHQVVFDIETVDGGKRRAVNVRLIS